MIFYTGVGSRKTPPEVLRQMTLYGMVFAELGYTLRSGAADGADSAFEKGADARNGSKEIYLPWKGYNGHDSNRFHMNYEASIRAQYYYGWRWKNLKPAVQALMTRNIFQVLGETLDTPSKFLICWTPDGARTAKARSRITGGTGQAIACAADHDIPVFNLQNAFEVDWLLDFVGELDD